MPMDKNVIIGVVNHSVLDVQELLGDKFPLYLVKRLIKGEKSSYTNSHLIFNNADLFGRAFKLGLITRTPFLFETVTVLDYINIHNNVVLIDADVHQDGFVDFKPIDVNEASSLLSCEWNKKYKRDTFFHIKKKGITQYGMQSNLADCINSILNTLPVFCYIPFMIAFVTGMNDKFRTFNDFVKDNRIVNKDNKQFFRTLDDILYSIRTYLNFLISGQTKKLKKALKKASPAKVANVRILHAYRRKYLQHNLSDWMDIEDNINLRYS